MYRIKYTLSQKGKFFWIKSKNILFLNGNLKLKRPLQELQEMKRAWNELGTNASGIFILRYICLLLFITLTKDLSKFRPVYAPKDFLEVVLGIKNTNITDFVSQYNSGLIQVPISVKSLAQIVSRIFN